LAFGSGDKDQVNMMAIRLRVKEAKEVMPLTNSVE